MVALTSGEEREEKVTKWADGTGYGWWGVQVGKALGGGAVKEDDGSKLGPGRAGGGREPVIVAAGSWGVVGDPVACLEGDGV